MRSLWSVALIVTALGTSNVYAQPGGKKEAKQDQHSCFVLNASPGCENEDCAARICEIEPSCCSVAWSGTCVVEALQRPGFCPLPDLEENSCFQENLLQLPTCADPVCQEIVCAQRPSCCTTQYDAVCVDIALENCQLPTQVENTCFETNLLEPGCRTETCLATVCDLQVECCSSIYDQQCVNLARVNTDTCIPPVPDNRCDVVSEVGGCVDYQCQDLVCTELPECCNSDELTGEWSQDCVNLANNICPQ